MPNTNENSYNPLNRSLMHLLHRSGQFASDFFMQGTGDTGLTPRQFSVLIGVHDNEGQSQAALVARTGIDRSTLADIVRRLHKKGLLQRRRAQQDQRAYSVRLTPQGRALLEAYRPNAANADKQLLNAIPAETRDGFIAILENLVHTLEGQRITSGIQAGE